MDIQFTNQNISFPLTLLNRVFAIFSTVRANFEDKNLFSSTISIKSESSFDSLGYRYYPNASTIDYLNIYGYCIIIGY